ncbi:hypothetical protein SISSUDRAFT_1133212 [Sistotremastrum suecicum HHB10207 ss-3]|uniref:F-box domain-containing protein n=1 Tax=Sistotremastrum suecicum HHB10207 ss-3 TaxID=1314776 RepID=A0A165XM10_9AGAM|nr:hypothetical protein SISSUDRAFT_1133212 [Sistotremastrum suecicum HHB10207 ss-3]
MPPVSWPHVAEQSANVPDPSHDVGRRLVLDRLESVARVFENALQSVRDLISETVKGGEKIGHWESSCRRTDSISFLRKTTDRLLDIQDSVESYVLAAVADVREQSNQYTEILRLPEELIFALLSGYVESHLQSRDTDRQIGHGVIHLDKKWIKLREVCRHWNNVLIGAAKLWSYIDLSWPLDVANSYVSLCQGVPLRLLWNIPVSNWDVDVSNYGNQKEWTSSHIHSTEELQLGIQHIPYSSWQRDKLVDVLRECCSPDLQSLRISLGHIGGDLEYAVVPIPALPTVNLLHLKLHNCWSSGPLSPSLQTIEIVALDPQIVTVKHIFQVLSGCPLLKSCVFDISAPGSLPPAFSVISLSGPMHLPNLRYLRLGDFSEPTFDWLYQRIRLELVPDMQITIIFVPEPFEPFKLPSRLGNVASRANSLDISRSSVRYTTEDQLDHRFSLGMPLRAQIESQFLPKLNFSPFTRVRRLSLGTYSNAYHSFWMEGLSLLRELHDLELCGSQTEISEVFLDLSETSPLICPSLQKLSIFDNKMWKWLDEQDETGGAFQSKKVIAQERLETLLKSRVGQGASIQSLKLFTPSWWTEDLDRWKPFVAVVETTGEYKFP